MTMITRLTGGIVFACLLASAASAYDPGVDLASSEAVAANAQSASLLSGVLENVGSHPLPQSLPLGFVLAGSDCTPSGSDCNTGSQCCSGTCVEPPGICE